MMTPLGLILIILAWSIQFISHSKTINSNFVILYAAGVALLCIDGVATGLTAIAVLNGISLISAVAVYFKITQKSKK